ncbi:hypothetical protein [Microscilla marina]|uniref:Uncharacterized protein n=1 Tax=Microscilla marina ATCC 23134 TaxID=313606 RepID=A1ZER4_MICM2|nr:hypothetical protein [Microscilla marina]EAY31016.1 hypothetical protein M23134_07423 [Microscilla marina ATCC 23134]
MKYTTIIAAAEKLTDEELGYLITRLDDMLSARYYHQADQAPQPQEYQKEVIPASDSASGFILEEFSEYTQGHLYLMCLPNGDCFNYALFTVAEQGMEDIFILVDGKQDWQEQLAPKIEQFFRQAST